MLIRGWLAAVQEAVIELGGWRQESRKRGDEVWGPHGIRVLIRLEEGRLHGSGKTPADWIKVELDGPSH